MKAWCSILTLSRTWQCPRTRLYVVIIVKEVDVAGPASVVRDEVAVAWRSFVTCICGQHALNAHADALNRLYRWPAGWTEEVQAYDSVAVYVRVDRDRARGLRRARQLDELDFRRLCVMQCCLVWPTKKKKKLVTRDNVTPGRKFNRTYWILRREREFESIDLILIKRILVQDSNIHLPLFKILRFGYWYTRGQMLFHLKWIPQLIPLCIIDTRHDSRWQRHDAPLTGP